jgi:hypothetical protein
VAITLCDFFVTVKTSQCSLVLKGLNGQENDNKEFDSSLVCILNRIVLKVKITSERYQARPAAAAPSFWAASGGLWPLLDACWKHLLPTGHIQEGCGCLCESVPGRRGVGWLGAAQSTKRQSAAAWHTLSQVVEGT